MIEVEHLFEDSFEISIRQHRLRVDQPLADGGADTAPTPTELFVASLAACVAHYARRYLARHDLPTEGLRAEASYQIVASPARVGEITVRLLVPPGVPEERRAGLLAVASHCTVHNTLQHSPAIRVELEGAASYA